MRTRSVVVAWLAFLIFHAGLLRAQPSEHDPGARVRVTTLHSGIELRLVGQVVRSDADSLVLHTSAARFALPMGEVRRIEVSRGKRPNTLKGAFFGALVTGTAFGLLAYSDEVSCQSFCSGDPLNAFAVFGGLGTIPGVFIGAAAGSIIRTERWKRVATGARVSLGPSDAGRASEIGLSLRIKLGTAN